MISKLEEYFILFSVKIKMALLLLGVFFVLHGKSQISGSAEPPGRDNYNIKLDSARSLLAQTQYKACAELSQFIREELRMSGDTFSSGYCNAIYLLGRSHYNLKNYLVAQSLIEEVIDRCQAGFKLLDLLQFHFILLNCHEVLGNPALAKLKLHQCLSSFHVYDFKDLDQYEGQEIKSTLITLRLFGRNMRDLYHDYSEAISIFEKTMLLYSNSGISEPAIYSMLLTDIGYSYFLLRKYEKAFAYYQEAERYVIHQNISSASTKAYLCSLLGKYHLHQRDFKLAEKYFEQGLSLMATAGNPENREYPFHLINYGMYCDSMKEHSKAIQYFEKAQSLIQMKDGKPGEMHATLNLYLGRAQLNLGQYSIAIHHFEEDQKILISKHDQNYYKLFYSYEGIGEAYDKWGLEYPQLDYHEKSLESFQKGFDLIRNFIRTSQDDIVKKLILSKSTTYCTKFLNALSRGLNKQANNAMIWNRCWEVSEFMHNSLLLLSLMESQSVRGSHIPDSLLLVHEMLKLKINELDYQYQETLKKRDLSVGDTFMLREKSKLNALKDSFRILSTRMEMEFPSVQQKQSGIDAIQIKSLQDALSPSQTVLEYFSTDTVLFLFVIKKHEYFMKTVHLDESLNNLVKQFNEGIYSYFLHPSGSDSNYVQQLRKYSTAATKLYRYLIEPVKSYLTKELIIIPDALLGKISFDAILIKPPLKLANLHGYHFLIKEHIISYNFSAATMFKMNELTYKDDVRNEFVGFAPFYKDEPVWRDSLSSQMESNSFRLSELKYSGEEVLQIGKLFQGKSTLLFGEDASRDAFLQSAPLYRILHIATHGQANYEEGKFSYLAFNGKNRGTGILYVTGADLQVLALKADMVVQSACETATGEYNSGNGIISLCSSIASTGAKSIVSTLWKVNDKSTMQIMHSFYSELKSGKSKNQALQLAKLGWLNKSHSYAKHPFYWTGFVLYGDTTRLF